MTDGLTLARLTLTSGGMTGGGSDVHGPHFAHSAESTDYTEPLLLVALDQENRPEVRS